MIRRTYHMLFATPAGSAGARIGLFPVLILLSMATATAVRAQPSWNVDPASFEKSMSLVVEVKADGVSTSAAADRIAAFVGDEVRGVATPTTVGSRNLYFLMTYANDESETISFKYYDSSANSVSEPPETSVFEGNGVVGTISDPFLLTAEPAQVDPSNWDVDPERYGSTMNVIATVFIDGVESTSADDRLAAFKGDVVRGVADPTEVQGKSLFFLTIYGDAAGESLTYRVYDASDDEVRDIAQTAAFESDDVVGTIAAPEELTVGDGGGNSAAPDWSINPSDFQHSMNIVARVEFGGSVSNDPDDELAAFSSGTIRGTTGSTDTGDGRLYFLTVYANGGGESLSLRGYDSSENVTRTLSPDLTFEPDLVLGSVANPLLLSDGADTNATDVNDVSTWSVNAASFEKTMNVVAEFKIDGEASGRTADRLAAVIDGEIRGVTSGTEVGSDVLFFLTVHGDEEGRSISFRGSDSSVDEVRILDETLSFAADGVEGSVASPFEVNAVWPADCVPNIEIEGGLVHVVRRTDPVVLLGSGSLPTCAVGTPDLGFKWRQVSGPAVSLTGTDRSSIQIPSGTLIAGQSHVFELTGFVTERPAISESVLVTLNVERSPLKAIISGGDRSVGQVDGFSLDASASYDPDDGDPVTTFAWTCTDQATSEPCKDETGEVLSLDPTGRILVPGQTLEPGTYIFEVTVSEDARTATQSVEITVVPGAAPVVEVSRAGSDKIDVTEELVLSGTATSNIAGSLSFEWSLVTPGEPDLSDPAVSPSGIDGEELRLAPDVLEKDQSYTFRLTVTDTNGSSGSAQLTVATNSGPGGGALSASPGSGTALVTEFQLSAAGWTDDDTPLTYQFLARRPDGTLVPLSDRVARSTAQVTLPRGDPNDGNTLAVVVRIEDALGASATTSIPVTVNPPPPTLTSVNLSSDTPDGEQSEDGEPRVPLDDDLSVDGMLGLDGLNLDLNGHTLDLGSSGSLDESGGRVTGSGEVRMNRELNAPAESDIGGIGLGLVSNSNLGNTDIRRSHSDVPLPGGSSSIKKKFAIEPETQPDDGITITIRFSDADLEGQDAAQLICFFFDDSTGEWTSDGVTVLTRTANTVTCAADHLSEWTLGGPDAETPLTANIRVFLQGPYSSGSMNSQLSGSLPSIQPYSAAEFSETAMAYSGSESVTTMPADVVDWVVVELRTDAGGTPTVGKRAGLLLTDGRVVDTDGSSRLDFGDLAEESYFIVVRHRNHLPVVSASAVDLFQTTGSAGAPFDFDFTTSTTRGGGFQPMADLGGAAALIAGDGDGDGEIQNDDKNEVWFAQLGSTGYLMGDFDLDGDVDEADRNQLWRSNVGRRTAVE